MSQVVYTDGSCHGNGTPGAKAGWAAYFGPKDRRNASGRVRAEFAQTNNVGELMGIKAALEQIERYHPNQTGHYTIMTDSEYAKNATTKWARAWERRGWATRAGNPVQNRPLIQDIRSRLVDLDQRSVTVQIAQCGSHGRGPHGNEVADAMANDAIRGDKDHYQSYVAAKYGADADDVYESYAESHDEETAILSGGHAPQPYVVSGFIEVCDGADADDDEYDEDDEEYDDGPRIVHSGGYIHIRPSFNRPSYLKTTGFDHLLPEDTSDPIARGIVDFGSYNEVYYHSSDDGY